MLKYLCTELKEPIEYFFDKNNLHKKNQLVLNHRPNPKSISVILLFLKKTKVEGRVLVLFRYIEDSQKKKKGRKKEDLDKMCIGCEVLCIPERKIKSKKSWKT